MPNFQYDYLDHRYRAIAPLGSPKNPSTKMAVQISSCHDAAHSTYLAQDDVTGQIAVKKYISAENLDVYETLKGITHRSLIRILYTAEKEPPSGNPKENPALVIMEYVSGKTIQAYQDEHYLFSETETEEYIGQMLAGLDLIHQKNIVHRDINPKNLLISTDGVLKILDFDIGRLYKSSQGKDTSLLGTADYAAPEQFGFSQSDGRTDIYAAGVLMNTMLTGMLPQEHIYSGKSPILGSLNAMQQKQRTLSFIIQKCIQMDPGKRFQSVSEILEIFHNQELSKVSIWPGFRSGILWKKITASAYYILMGIYSTTSIIECAKTFQAAVLEATALFIYIWLSVFLSLDFGHWIEQTPILRRLGRMQRIIFCIALWIFLFYAGCRLEQYVHIDLLHTAVR